MLVESVLQAKGSGVVTANPDISVGEAARIMMKHRIGAVVLTEGSGAAMCIAGIFSERDIVRGMALHGEAVCTRAVRDFMSTTIVVCSPADTLDAVMAAMTTRRVRHLPVIEDGRLIGIVTIGDVVKNRLDEATLVVDSLRSYVMDTR